MRHSRFALFLSVSLLLDGALLRLSRRVLALGLVLVSAASWTVSSVHAQETIEYYGTDHLGSVRVVFDATGNVLSRTDYLPFGEEVFAPTAQMPAQQFTGQARDGEAGQDYFHALMYQPRTGRFNAVDPVFNALHDPQKWNRYSYGRQNPLIFIDRDGRDPMLAAGMMAYEAVKRHEGVTFVIEADIGTQLGGGINGFWLFVQYVPAIIDETRSTERSFKHQMQMAP